MCPESVEQVLTRYNDSRRCLVEVLQDIQDREGYLPEEAIRRVAERLDVPLIEVYRVANFYKSFTLRPRGKHVLTVCKGTACHVRGADRLLDELRGQLQIESGETTEDGQFTVEAVNCVGACALGPVVVVDGEYHGHMTPHKLRGLVASLQES